MKLDDINVPGVSLKARGGMVQMTVSHGFDEVTGRRRRFYKTVPLGTKRELERVASRFLEEVRREEVPEPGQGTLEDYLRNDWLPEVTRVSRKGTPLRAISADTYEAGIRRVCKRIGTVPLAKLNARHVEGLRNALLNEGMSPTTVRWTLSFLAMALSRAVARGNIRGNPASTELVRRPSPGEDGAGRVRVPYQWSVASAKELLAALPTAPERVEVAGVLGLGCGLRRAEVLALNWENADGVVRVERALTRSRAVGLALGPPKTRKARREVDAPQLVQQVLKRHRARQAERRLAGGDLWLREWKGEPMNLVVERGDGGPVRPSDLSKEFSRWANANGFKGITFHDLRRGFATMMLGTGVPPKVVADLMGHEDTATLEQIYQQVAPELKDEAARKLDALLGS